NASALDYETTPAFVVTVLATDSGSPALASTATVTINLADVNETPVVGGQTFGINENSAVGAIVGAVAATDPDAGQSLTYAIVGGNTGGAFTINAATGRITVANPAAVDFETNPTFNLFVRVSDSGSPSLSSSAVVTINLNDVNDAPVLDNSGAMSLHDINL